MRLQQRAKHKITRVWEALQPHYRVNGLTIPSRKDNLDLLFWQQNWKSQIIDKVLSAQPGLFLDVGVNIGHTLVDYCGASTRSGYIGFEPNSRCVERAQEIINASSLKDCTVIPAGLSSQNAILNLYIRPGEETDSCATLIPDLRPGQEVQAIHVPTYRFDDLGPGILLGRRVSLVKIDVEGGELAVLAGMSKLLCSDGPWIICEVLRRHSTENAHAYADRSDALLGLLRSHRYEIWRVEKSGDDVSVLDYTPVQTFPDDPFSAENADLCDYIFVPPGKSVRDLN